MEAAPNPSLLLTIPVLLPARHRFISVVCTHQAFHTFWKEVRRTSGFIKPSSRTPENLSNDYLMSSPALSGIPQQSGLASLRQGPGRNGSSFHGCIRNLYINDQLQDLTQFLLQEGVVPGCQPCQRSVCAHGQCHTTGHSSFSCECEAGWTGQLCDQQINNPCDGNK